MQRSTGLFLLAVGVLITGLGVMGLWTAFATPEVGELFAVFGILLVVGLALLYAAYRILRATTPFGATPAGGDGRVGGYLPDATETRKPHGLPCEVFYQTPVHGKNGRPSLLRVSVAATAPAEVQCSAENWFDRLCKRMGLAHEHQTRDRAFDDAVYVRCPSDAYARRYLEDDKKRAAVRALMKLGFPEVRLTGTAIEAVWTGFNPETDDADGLVEEAAKHLHALARNVPQDDPEGAIRRVDRRPFYHAALWVVLIGFAATLGFVWAFPPLRVWDLLLAGLATFAVVYPVFGWVAAALLRGTSTAHDQWAKLMSLGILLVGMGSVGTVAAIDALADGPLEIHTATIASKRISTGKRNSKSYYVSVPAWDRPGQTLEFSVSSGDYDRVVANHSRLELTTGRGALGIPWLKAKRVLP